VKEEHWNRFEAVTGSSLSENMLLAGKKLILLAILVGVLRIDRGCLQLGNRTLTTDENKKGG